MRLTTRPSMTSSTRVNVRLGTTVLHALSPPFGSGCALAGLRASPLSVHPARAASAYGRRLLLAAPSLHQIAERVERCLQTLFDRVGIVLQLTGDRTTCRRDVGSE